MIKETHEYVATVLICDMCQGIHILSDPAIYEFKSGKHICRNCAREAIANIPSVLSVGAEDIAPYFRMFGIGHFDLTNNEINYVIRQMVAGDLESISSLYEKLSEKRLG